MLPVCKFNVFVYFILLLVVNGIRSEDQNITIALNKTLTLNNKELYGEFVTINSNSTLSLTLTDVNKNVSYIILQAHSHYYNITLYQNVLVRNSSVTGTNVGLYGTVSPPDNYYVLNKNMMDLKLYISVHGYRSMDPIAGGCNLESSVPISPFMHLNYTQDMISFDAPAAKAPDDPNCNGKGSRVSVEFYRMYLKERDFNEDSYFYGLMNMMTLAKIKENGIQVPETNFYMRQRRFLSAYPGTGAVYVAVAYLNPSLYSIYVPTYTYACVPSDGCEILDDNVSQFCCAGLIFIGLFVCFFGHRFFKTEMFLVGTFAGIIVTYMLMSMWTELDRPAILGASLLTGLFFGAIWILLWWFYGIPVLSVALATMHLGFIVAAIVYHSVPGGNAFFTNDGQFWSIFTLLMIGLSVTLTTVSYTSNILSCAILGSYAVVFSIDHYVNSNLKYIMYNTVRRAVVDDFNFAVLVLPYQWRDILMTLVWIALAVCGFLFQYYHNRGRPPFPPPPRSSINRVTEPLTYGAIEGRRRFFGLSNGLDRSVVAANERSSLLEDTE